MGFLLGFGVLGGFLGFNWGQKLWKWGKKVIAGGAFDDYNGRFGYKDFIKRLPKLSFEVLKNGFDRVGEPCGVDGH